MSKRGNVNQGKGEKKSYKMTIFSWPKPIKTCEMRRYNRESRIWEQSLVLEKNSVKKTAVEEGINSWWKCHRSDMDVIFSLMPKAEDVIAEMSQHWE